MVVSEFLRHNRDDLDIYRKTVRIVGIVILAGAVWLLVGGIVRILFFELQLSEQMQTNAYGFAGNFEHLVHQIVRLSLIGLLALAIGDYLGYVIDVVPRPRLGFIALPGILIAGAAWALFNAGSAIVTHNAWQHLESVYRPIFSEIVSAFIWGALPKITGAVAQIGMAVVVLKLNDILIESKATV